MIVMDGKFLPLFLSFAAREGDGNEWALMRV